MPNGSGLFSNSGPYKPHLVRNRSGGVPGEVGKLREDIATIMDPLAAITVDEFTNAPAASVNAIKLAIASAITAQVYHLANFGGALHGGPFTPPRPVSVTCSNHGATWVGSITVTGLDIDGRVMTEAIALTNNATTTGAKMFAVVTQVNVPAQADALGTFSIGIGALLGLTKTPKLRTAAAVLVQELMDGAAINPITGTISAAATNLPHGAYTAATPPNGAHDYAIYYEYLPSLSRQRFLARPWEF